MESLWHATRGRSSGAIILALVLFTVSFIQPGCSRTEELVELTCNDGADND